MLDFRFLLGAVILFVLTVLAGLRIFGATEPLLATMGDQPRVEAVALPRHIPTVMPNVPRAAKADGPFVRPAAIEVPASVKDIAETIPREPPLQEITGSVEPAPAQEIEEASTPQPPSPPAAEHRKEEITGSAEPAPPQEIEEAPTPRAKPRPAAQQRKKEEVTGSVAPAQTQAIEAASKPRPKPRPKRRPVAQPRKQEPETAKSFPFFFPFNSQTK